jgi:hypothetical protein
MFLSGVGIASADEKTSPAVAIPGFAAEIQPLLKRHCLKCHGPAKHEGKLNLSTPAGIIRGGMNGAVLVPHDPKASLLWKRVAEDEMPPEDPLADGDKDLLKRWIVAGAPGLPNRNSVAGKPDGKDHWAFQPLRPIPVPSVRDGSRLVNEIDLFLQAALEKEGLSLGPEADRPTLVRRISFDLTGLPPSVAEIDEFVNDKAPQAYARMVDRYLASPHYGERWGKYWLDAAGYADSNGYFNADSDRPLAWRYRDWVVRALNADMPFDRFVREQIAGDEIARFVPGSEATPEIISLLEATHYLRNSQDGTGESDGNADEVRVDRYTVIEGTIQNVTNSLFGLTIQCAKCHDHKFEPIPQRDYYQFQAVFAPVFNLQSWMKPNDRFVYASLPGEFEKWDAAIKALDAEITAQRNRVSDWARQNRPRGLDLFSDNFDSPGSPLSDRWSSTAPGDNAPGGDMPVQIDSDRPPGLLVQEGRLKIITAANQGEGWVSTKEKFDWTPDEIGGAVQVTFDLVANRFSDSEPHAERIGYYVSLHDFHNDAPLVGGNLLIDGNPGAATTVYLDYPGGGSHPKGEIGATPYKPGRNYGVRITHVEQGKFKLEHLVDFIPEGKSLMMAEADLPDGGFGFEYYSRRNFAIDNLSIERFSGTPEGAVPPAQFQKEYETQKKRLDEIQKKRSAAPDRPGKIAWVSDLSETPPEVFLLERGDYAKPAVKVNPAGLTVLSDPDHPFTVCPPAPPLKSTGNRLAFAEWVTARGSTPAALMARVQVNRIWHRHFGTGIVSPVDNLGISGAAPSHPELLEWLAHELASASPPLSKGGAGGGALPATDAFESQNQPVNAAELRTPNSELDATSPLLREGVNAWTLKRLHRLILNSAAYRQVSRSDGAAKQRDPDNRLLWRFPVRRLDAEAIRDALLAVSGELDPRLSGPFAATKRTDAGDVVPADSNGSGRRRSIYLQQRRTQVTSLLAVFDAPTIVFNSVQRPVSTMPLQTLALLNSAFVVDRAKAFAARVEHESQDDTARLRLAYLTAWGREPQSAELESARQFLDTQAAEYQSTANPRSLAWVDFCQMLLAANEFLYVE